MPPQFDCTGGPADPLVWDGNQKKICFKVGDQPSGHTLSGVSSSTECCMEWANEASSTSEHDAKWDCGDPGDDIRTTGVGGKNIEFKTLWMDGECSGKEEGIGKMTLDDCQEKCAEKGQCSHIDWGGAGGCDKTLFGKTVELFKTLWTDGECSKPEVEVGVITLQACQKKCQDEADCSHIDWGGNSCRENMFKQVMSKGNSGSQKCKCFINKRSTGGCGKKSRNNYMTQQNMREKGHKAVTVGRSGSHNRKSVSCQKCSGCKDIKDHSYGDTWRFEYSNTEVTAIRTDSSSPWNHNLKVVCQSSTKKKKSYVPKLLTDALSYLHNIDKGGWLESPSLAAFTERIKPIFNVKKVSAMIEVNAGLKSAGIKAQFGADLVVNGKDIKKSVSVSIQADADIAVGLAKEVLNDLLPESTSTCDESTHHSAHCILYCVLCSLFSIIMPFTSFR